MIRTHPPEQELSLCLPTAILTTVRTFVLHALCPLEAHRSTLRTHEFQDFFKSLSAARHDAPGLLEDRPLVARARRLAGVNGRGEARAVRVANRPLARWAMHVPIGAQADQGVAAGLRRAVRVGCVGVALREEALRGEAILGGAHECIESDLVAALGLGLG